jgi:hypothetical protein
VLSAIGHQSLLFVIKVCFLSSSRTNHAESLDARGGIPQ